MRALLVLCGQEDEPFFPCPFSGSSGSPRKKKLLAIGKRGAGRPGLCFYSSLGSQSLGGATTTKEEEEEEEGKKGQGESC